MTTTTHPQVGELVRYFPGRDFSGRFVFNPATGLVAIITHVGIHPHDSRVEVVHLTVFTFYGKPEARESVPERTGDVLDSLYSFPLRPAFWCRPECLDRRNPEAAATTTVVDDVAGMTSAVVIDPDANQLDGFVGECVTITREPDHGFDGFVIHLYNTVDADDHIAVEISTAEAREIIQGLASLL